MKILPAKEVVALKPTSVAPTKGLIEVVEKNVPETGEVIALGLGKQPIPMKVGSVVAYRKFGEFKFWLGGKEIMFVKFEDILGVLK